MYTPGSRMISELLLRKWCLVLSPKVLVTKSVASSMLGATTKHCCPFSVSISYVRMVILRRMMSVRRQ